MRQALEADGLPLCAFQTGASYATRGNCLCSPDVAVRQRTITLLHMNIEEQDMIAPLAGVREILAHVHLSETNRDLLLADAPEVRPYRLPGCRGEKNSEKSYCVSETSGDILLSLIGKDCLPCRRAGNNSGIE